MTNDDLVRPPAARRTAPALPLLLLLASCAAATTPAQVTPPKAGEVRVVSETGRTVVDVTSPGGIGSATLRVPDSTCRRPVVFRFHLKGLEQFVLAYGRTRFELSLSAADLDRPPLVTVAVAGVVVPDAAGDPRYRIDIDAGDPIVIGAPPDFAGAACEEFAVSWVDFFRR